MTIFLIKTPVSIIFLVLALIGTFTMFEILGRSEKRFNVDKLKKIHRVNGMFFFIVYLILAGLGMTYIALTGEELSPRGAFHVMLAHAVLFLFLLKLAIIKAYRQFYGKVAVIGITLAILALGTVASSTGYFVLSGGLFSKKNQAAGSAQGVRGAGPGTAVADIVKGRKLYRSKCLSCHDTTTDSSTGAPGFKGIMKRKTLPASGRPVTVENIELQLKRPYRAMPAFPDLTGEEKANIIAYMKTL